MRFEYSTKARKIGGFWRKYYRENPTVKNKKSAVFFTADRLQVRRLFGYSRTRVRQEVDTVRMNIGSRMLISVLIYPLIGTKMTFDSNWRTFGQNTGTQLSCLIPCSNLMPVCDFFPFVVTSNRSTRGNTEIEITVLVCCLFEIWVVTNTTQ